jgi:hypothetical protein
VNLNPDLVNDDEKLLENSFVVPDAAPADAPASLRLGKGVRAECHGLKHLTLIKQKGCDEARTHWLNRIVLTGPEMPDLDR